MVLSVPLRQMREIILDGVELHDLVRFNQLDDVCLGTTLLADLLTFGSNDDAVQRLLGPHSPFRLVIGRQGNKLDFPTQLVEAEEVIVI